MHEKPKRRSPIAVNELNRLAGQPVERTRPQNMRSRNPRTSKTRGAARKGR